MATGAECEGYSLIQSGFAVKPNGSCINYIWNSAVFLFNTLLKKKKKKKKMRRGEGKIQQWACPGMYNIHIKCQTHFTFNIKVQYIFILDKTSSGFKGNTGGFERAHIKMWSFSGVKGKKNTQRPKSARRHTRHHYFIIWIEWMDFIYKRLVKGKGKRRKLCSNIQPKLVKCLKNKN